MIEYIRYSGKGKTAGRRVGHWGATWGFDHRESLSALFLSSSCFTLELGVSAVAGKKMRMGSRESIRPDCPQPFPQLINEPAQDPKRKGQRLSRDEDSSCWQLKASWWLN